MLGARARPRRRWHPEPALGLDPGVSQTQPRPFAEMGLAHYRAALAGAAPTIHRIALEFQGFACDYECVALPLAAGGGLPPMVLTFIACDIPRSRRFWERYAGT